MKKKINPFNETFGVVKLKRSTEEILREMDKAEERRQKKLQSIFSKKN